jgi:hypothetical protein
VIGIADAKWGERVHAVIIPRDGEKSSEIEILDWCGRGQFYAAHSDRKNTPSCFAYAAQSEYRMKDHAMNTPATKSQDLNTDEQSCAAWVARFLKARGVDRIFGLQGGHIQPIWDHVARQGIRIIDVRDEGAAVHMAHAHAELTGQFGVAMVTAGPGVTNTVTAIANAWLARVPVLLISGCTSRPQANMGPLQDIPHVDILRPVTRTSRTARVPEQAIRELDEAVARAMGDAGEPGPVYLNFQLTFYARACQCS